MYRSFAAADDAKIFLKVLPPTQQSAAQLDRLRHVFFHSSVKHHYIFITRRRMTETVRE